MAGDVETDLLTKGLIFFLALSCALLISSIAWKKGYYRWPVATPFQLSLRFVVLGIVAFFLYFAMQLVALLFLAITFAPQTVEGQAWVRLASIIWSAFIVVFYSLMVPFPVASAVWGDSSSWRSKGRQFLFGAASWPIVYPAVVAWSQLIEIVLLLLWAQAPAEQAVVMQFKGFFEYPFLFICYAITLTFIVPIAEEVLFRGWVLPALVAWIGRTKGLVLSALIFALFHVSESQGLVNLTIVSSLFILSLYLGHLRLRQQNLWASIGLHCTFNGVSVWLVIAELA